MLGRSSVHESISVPPIRNQDLPQYIPSNNLLACLVCGSMIDISDKKEQHVVKCNNCNEATVNAIKLKLFYPQFTNDIFSFIIYIKANS